jgi:hypothetical protein
MGKAVLLLVGTLATSGCGNAQNDPAPQTGGVTSGGSGSGGTGGAAGNSNVSGNAPGGSSAGGAKPVGDTMAEACLAYSVAVCKRRAECGGFSGDDCPTAGTNCPDSTASPGATRTVEGLKACAVTYETLPCDQVNAGILPPCVTPGERAQGEPCVFPSQCSGLSCKYTDADCGKCAVEVGMGESCAADDVECAAGFTCGANDVCVPITPPATPAGPNEPCVNTPYSCVEDYWCPLVPNAVCTPLPALGQPCEDPTVCASGSYCLADQLGDRACVAAPGQGEPCAAIFPNPEPYICGKGLLCSYTSPTEGTCEPVPMAGEPCNFPPSNPTYGRCAASNCNFGFDPPMCRMPGTLGDPCAVRQDCELQFVCECPEADPDCAQTICVSYKLGGEACGADMTAKCHPAFDCTAGTCQPAEVRGVFAEACGN